MLQEQIELNHQQGVKESRPDDAYDFLEAGVTGLTRLCTEMCILGGHKYYIVMQSNGCRLNRLGVWYPRNILAEARNNYGQRKSKLPKPDWRNEPPTDRQLEYLQNLGYTDPLPTSKGEAGELIAKWKAKQFAEQVARDVCRALRPGEE